VARLSHTDAVAGSLVAVTAAAASATVGYARQKRIDVTTAAVFVLAAIPGSAVGAWLTTRVSSAQFGLMMALVLAAAAFPVILLPRTESERKRPAREGPLVLQRTYLSQEGVPVPYCVDLRWGLAISLGIGVLGGFFGIGGGIVYVPVMFLVLGVPFRIAAATSSAILVPQSLTALGTLWATGVTPGPSATWLAVGSLIGGLAGAALTARLPGFVLRIVLAAVLLGTAALMGLKYFGVI
jgi:uncharacterized membrane protein YfcA